MTLFELQAWLGHCSPATTQQSLRIDSDTQEERLLAHDTIHPPGRSEAGRQQIRDGRPVFEAQMLKLGAIALDGTASTDAVADHLLALAFGDK